MSNENIDKNIKFLNQITGHDFEYKAGENSGTGKNHYRIFVDNDNDGKYQLSIINKALANVGIKFEPVSKGIFIGTMVLGETLDDFTEEYRNMLSKSKYFGFEKAKEQVQNNASRAASGKRFLKELTGADWEYKSAHESGLGVDNYRLPARIYNDNIFLLNLPVSKMSKGNETYYYLTEDDVTHLISKKDKNVNVIEVVDPDIKRRFFDKDKN